MSQTEVQKELPFNRRQITCELGYTDTMFCFCDLDLDLMTLIYEVDLDILKMYLHND